MSTLTSVRCPSCKRIVHWNRSSPFRPFCSKRCQNIDFNEWIYEEKRIPSIKDYSENNE